MSHRDLNDRVTVAFGSSRVASSGTDRSKLRPAFGVQPKSLPDPDHHRCDFEALSPLSKAESSRSLRPGSLATNISEFCTRLTPPCPSVRVHGVPSGRCQVIVSVSCFESVIADLR